MSTYKSSIQELRDQLFLDRADGKYLSNVGANIGLERPVFGFHNDDLWRAIVRRLAVDYRQIANLFRDLLTLIYGPRTTVVTVLAQSVFTGDDTFTVADQMRIPQLGSMLIDEGLVTEETIYYTFRDPRNGLVTLGSDLTQDHAALTENGSGTLRSASNVGDTLIELEDSSYLPTSGFPVPILIDAGTDFEEVVSLSANDVTYNVLTVGALAYAHAGPTPTSISTKLVSTEGSSSVLKVSDSSAFPEEGVLRVQQDDGRAGEVRTTHATGVTTAGSTTSITDGLASFGTFDDFLVEVSGGALAQTNLRVISTNTPTVINVTNAFRSGGAPTNPHGPAANYDVRVGQIRSGTLSAGGAATATLEAGLDVYTDELAGFTLVLTGGVGVGQRRRITTHTDGVSSVMTVDPAWVVQPDATSTYEIRIAGEDIRFLDNDVDGGALQLKTPVVGTYTVGGGATVSVTLLELGAEVQTSQIKIVGTNWDVIETEQGVLKIYIPPALDPHRLQDVSYIHQEVISPTPASTVRAGGSSAGDVILPAPVNDIDDFPTAGVIRIDSGNPNDETLAYTRQDSGHFTTIYGNGPTLNHATGTASVGGTSTRLLDTGASWTASEFVGYFIEASGGLLTTDTNLRVISANAPTTIDVTNAFRDLTLPVAPDGATYNVVTGMVRAGTCSAGAAGTATLETTLDLATDELAGATLVITGGTGPGQSRKITANTDGTSSVLSVTPNWDTNPDATSTYEIKIGVPVGSTILYVEDITVLDAFDFVNADKELQIDRAGVPETVVYTSFDLAANMITLASATTANHSSEDTVHPIDGDLFYMARPLVNAHLATETIDLVQSAYAATNLEDGRIETATDHLFQGPYIFDLFQRAAEGGTSATSPLQESTLDENVAGPTRVMTTQRAGSTALEVEDASLFITTGAFDVDVTIRESSQEQIDVTGVTLKKDVTGVTVDTAGSTAGDLVVPISNISFLPTPPVTPYRYRILVDRGGGNEEILLTSSISGGDLTVVDATTNNHVSGETVEILSDIIELSEVTTIEHVGVIPRDQVYSLTPGPLTVDDRVSRIYEIRTYIDVVDASEFPSAGSYALVNFGRQFLPVESRIREDVDVDHVFASGVTDGVGASPTLQVVDSTATFEDFTGYFVEVTGGGLVEDNIRLISSNTTTIIDAAQAFRSGGAPTAPHPPAASYSVATQIHTGTLSAGAVGTVNLEVGVDVYTSELIGLTIVLTGGTGAGQRRSITANADGVSALVTISPNWDVTPDGTTTYEIRDSAQLYLEDTDDFPTSYPYYVDIGVDTAVEEHLQVSANDTTLDRLTISSDLSYPHRGDGGTAQEAPQGEWVRYYPGEQETVRFTGTVTGAGTERLLFSSGIKLSERHLIGEPVVLSGVTSNPAGLAQEFPFYLPGSYEDRLRFLFDRGRAAGVEVIIIEER